MRCAAPAAPACGWSDRPAASTGATIRPAWRRYREDPTTPKMLEPGMPVRITVELFPTANLLKAVHRIRLDIASSELRITQPPDRRARGRWRRMRVAENTVFVDAARPFRLVLPLVR
ncbi:CocE/NonD family hydrolase C-terminal non-catalytic domain-containing protein [Pseudoroseomonas ludipueritiae]|uniref:Xaa-Pro dipeptidyl-peptidase C-terminal domain-containing protein n=1 Tax=Pseudoroseomonas ludipueritiae TaxID=198093 RepID=A0ABR7RDW8_9PROT|nr:CocE/NonD family hydrolase C-terminal non-catalytic domain-containing protein [Pseudoroseomonas ludipueritiae]MBC9179873.1 hypothetical protein [Pseudoroseomonas ludipueritiae]